MRNKILSLDDLRREYRNEIILTGMKGVFIMVAAYFIFSVGVSYLTIFSVAMGHDGGDPSLFLHWPIMLAKYIASLF